MGETGTFKALLTDDRQAGKWRGQMTKMNKTKERKNKVEQQQQQQQQNRSALHGVEDGDKFGSLNALESLSLSLSLTHTHTHTQTQTLPQFSTISHFSLVCPFPLINLNKLDEATLFPALIQAFCLACLFLFS